MFKNFPEQWQDLLKEKGITTETAIQKNCLHQSLKGDNVLGISPTGTGKTLPTFSHCSSPQAQKSSAIAYPSTQFLSLLDRFLMYTKQWAEPWDSLPSSSLSGSSQATNWTSEERTRNSHRNPGRVFELIKLKRSRWWMSILSSSMNWWASQW